MPGAFVDPNIPANFSPFNILALGGRLYVACAQKKEDGNDEVDGPGLGIVDAFDTSGHLLQRVATGGTLNAPWGMAIGPANNGSTAQNLPSNTLVFAAGPNGAENGVFGRIDAASP
jgi:uncharacterized protein (TIGR03118 family)